jgi:hypothetical protein
VKAGKETDLVRAVLTLIRLRGGLAVRVNSGGSVIGKQFVRHCDTVGMSDVVACFRGAFIALEAKGERGRLRPSQRAFLDAVEKAGGVALVVKDLRQVEAALDALEDKG